MLLEGVGQIVLFHKKAFQIGTPPFIQRGLSYYLQNTVRCSSLVHGLSSLFLQNFIPETVACRAMLVLVKGKQSTISSHQMKAAQYALQHYVPATIPLARKMFLFFLDQKFDLD